MKTTSSQMNYGERSKNVEQDEVKELTYSHMMDSANIYEEDIKESHSGREAIIDTSNWSRMMSRS